MAVYGDFDGRFRPRPALWRLAIVSFAQFAIALLITNLLVSLAEMGLLAYTARPARWIIHATAWSTLPRLADPEPQITAAVAFGFVILGALVLTLWPTRNTLARRLFVSIFAQAVSVFGATAFALRHESLLGLAVALAALWLCARAELRAIGVLASVTNLDRPLPRLKYWFVRIVPAMAALACVPLKRNWWLAGGLTLVTLLMNTSKRPARFEVVEEPELREAAATLSIVAVAVLAYSAWMWPRKLVITKNGVRVERFVRSPAARS
jgi:hypothetical protein